MTGATGAVLAIRLLQVLQEVGIETHLILSKWAVATLKYETDMTASDVNLSSSETLVLNLTWLTTCRESFLNRFEIWQLSTTTSMTWPPLLQADPSCTTG